MSRTVKKTKSRAGDWIQLLGLVVCGIGIGLELALAAALWFTVITAGSVLFAIGTKLKGE